MNEKRDSGLNPFMIESYFDGEVGKAELEGIDEAVLEDSEAFRALSELRSVVRVDTQLALREIDGYALWNAISDRISDGVPRVRNFGSDLSRSKRRTSKQFFQRWAPALIGSALFLLSIPGFVLWGVSMNRTEVQPQTVVVIDSAARQDQGVVSYPVPAPRPWNAPGADTAAVLPSPELQVKTNDTQLTVEEMDFAIRHLMRRIESLEDANRSDIESGRKALIPSENGGQL